uniref:Sodium channel protein n=1 Tax=Petromyzon marinus TaxID=7757 RepID=S4RAR1_PETMA
MSCMVGIPQSSGFFRHFTKESVARIEEQIAWEKERKADKDSTVVIEKVKPLNFLEADRTMPFVYGEVPQKMISEPLEDLDPYYRNKMTFLVLNKGKTIFRFNACKALCLFTVFNPIRRISIKILTHTLFTILIMATILTNCVFMAINTELKVVEYVFTAIYMFEALVKILARGFFFGAFTYLRDPWNWLDLAVLVIACFTSIPGFANLSALRMFRVMRALKTISVVPGLKTIVRALIQSVKKLSDVTILTLFCLSIFALIALQLFKGNLKNKCVRWPIPGNSNFINISQYLEDKDNYYFHKNVPLLCSNSSENNTCPDGFICFKAGKNPNYGYTNYDNFGWAFLSLFRLMTQDYWENLYQLTLRASGKVYMIFFVMVIFLGSFYLINLILAVVAKSYEEQNQATQQEAERKKDELQEMLEQLKIQKEDQVAMVKFSRVGGVLKNLARLAHDHSSLSACSSGTHLFRIMSTYAVFSSSDQDNFRNFFLLGVIGVRLRGRRRLLYKNNEAPRDAFVLSPRCIDMSQFTLAGAQTKRDLPYEEGYRTIFEEEERSTLQRTSTGSIRSTARLTNQILNGCKQNTRINYSANVTIRRPHVKVHAANHPSIALSLPLLSSQVSVTSLIATIIGYDQLTAIKSLRTLRALRPLRALSRFEGMRISGCAGPLRGPQSEIIFGSPPSPLGDSLSFKLVIILFSLFYVALPRESSLLAFEFEPIVYTPLFVFELLGVYAFCSGLFAPGASCHYRLAWLASTLVHGITLDPLPHFLPLCSSVPGPPQVRGPRCACAAYTLDSYAAALLPFVLQPQMTGATRDKQHHRWYQRSRMNDALASLQLEDVEEIRYIMSLTHGRTWCLIENKLVPLVWVRLLAVRLYIARFISRDMFTLSISDGRRQLVLMLLSMQWSTESPLVLADLDIECISIYFEYIAPEYISVRKNRIIKYKCSLTKKSGITLYQTAWEQVPLKDLTKLSKCRTILKESLKTQRGFSAFCPPIGCCFAECSTCVRKVESLGLGSAWWVLGGTKLQSACTNPCSPLRCKQNLHYVFFLVCKHYSRTKTTLPYIVCVYSNHDKLPQTVMNKNHPLFSFKKMYEIMILEQIYTTVVIPKFSSCWMIANTSYRDPMLYRQAGVKSATARHRACGCVCVCARPLTQVVVNALVGAIPSIMNVLLVCLIFWLIFSIMGVNFFKGKFSKCVNSTDDSTMNESIIPNQNACLEQSPSLRWKNLPVNFDNVASGYLALLQVSTFKGWMDIMYAAVDSRQNNTEQPRFEESLGYYLFFVIFIIFGAFFILNLFIGVIIDNFNQQKKKFGGEDIFLTEEQRKYHNAMKKLGSKKPRKPVPRPNNKYQGMAYDLVHWQAFEIGIMVLICLNMLTMMIEADEQSEAMKTALNITNIVFIGIFTTECVLKMFALRQYFFTFPWNVFDFAVVTLSVFDLAMADNSWLSNIVEPTLFRVVRLFRVGRILRLIRGAQGIRTLLFALLMSLPALFNIGLLLFVVMFIFSVFGMSNFGYLKHTAGIDEIFNFETFGGSMLCLFQITTSAGWDGLLAPTLLSKEPDCEPEAVHVGTNVVGNCGNKAIGCAFFVTYIIISFLIVVNMYIAVILENFNVATAESSEPLSEDDFEMFYDIWGKFDPNATQFISFTELPNFIDSLDEPLRVPKPNQLAVAVMDLPIVEGDRIHCLEVLFALTKRVLGQGEGLEGLREQMEERFIAANPEQVNLEPVTTTLQRQQQEMAALKIQKAYRKYL